MNIKKIFYELKHHAPFTFIASLMAVILVILIKFYFDKDIPESFFHIAHPAHLFVSAIVTSAIYYKYKKKIFNGILIGISGAIIIGTLSDVLFPWLGGVSLNLDTSFHLPLIEQPFLIISTALLGSLVGVATQFTKMPHFLHVFLSIFASLFYILSFSRDFGIIYFIGVFLIVFVAVLIPCCISDIIYPILFVKHKR